MSVSRNDHKRGSVKPEKWTEPRVPILNTETDGKAALIKCSCGWDAFHHRAKVAENRAQRHLDKRHGGQGMWL